MKYYMINTAALLLLLVLALIGCSGLSEALQLGSRPHQYFLDTAEVDKWEKLLPMGIYHGITTNPLLLERAKVPCTMKNLIGLANVALNDYRMNCFMLQSWGGNRESLIENGLRIASISDKIVVKIPLTEEGIYAASILKRQNVPICMTACYSPHQVFTSVGLQADYVAPYLGRISDIGPERDGVREVIQMQRIVEGLNSVTRVFVASLREASQLSTLAAAGCNTFTFSPAIAEALLNDPMTISAAESFESSVLKSLSYSASTAPIQDS